MPSRQLSHICVSAIFAAIFAKPVSSAWNCGRAHPARSLRRQLAAGDMMPLARPRPTGVSMTAGPHAELIVQHPIPAAWERIEEDQDPLPQELIGRDLLQCTSSGKLVVAGPSWDPMQIASPGFLVQQYYTSLGPLPDASWAVAAVWANQSTFRLGRAYQPATNKSRSWFPVGPMESNASATGSPSFYVLHGASDGTRVTASNSLFVYEYQMVKRNGPLAPNVYWFDVDGSVPCCINASVPDYQTDATVSVGNVMGSCAPSTGEASITWRGTVFSQDINNAMLLAVNVQQHPGPDHTGAIVGGVLGGLAGLALLLWLIVAGIWSWRSYSFRAYKRLLEDQVYSLVIGMRSDDIFAPEPADNNLQDAVNIDRFYNMLPFINRMPRNQYYANLTRSVAHGCLRQWSNLLGTQPRILDNGVLNARFDGVAAEALTFCIMKHDTIWSATDNAILQQWGKGRAARGRVLKEIEHLLNQPEISDFLDGLDARPLSSDQISSGGFTATLKRIFCCALPPRILKETQSNEPATNQHWDESLFTVELPTAAQSKGTSGGSDSGGLGSLLGDPLMSSAYKMGGSSASKAASDHAAAMSAVFKQLQLDDWEIKPHEIEIMTGPDGEPCKLGEGAFGAVYKAKWNGVQIVAVKKLHKVTSESAKLEFLREVAVLKRLRSENIVRFLGVCFQDSQTMLVTELMSNGSLHNSIRDSHSNASGDKDGDVSWYNKGKRIAMDITRGVAFLHSQGIVHFDLKSPNILLARDFSAKVADVGLAKFMTNEHFTQVTTIGTLAWAAPELLSPHLGLVSSKIDVYSLGVVIWELVVRESPRFGQNWYRPPRVPEECPQWVADLIVACMHPDPLQRLSSKEAYHALLADNYEK